jgi:hypothetical protein
MQYRDFFINLDADCSIKSYFEGNEKKGGKLEFSNKLRENLKDFLDPEPKDKWEEIQVVNFGDDLRKALLNGDVADQFDLALRTVEGEKQGLRIVLRIDPAYAGYPWEAMSKKDTPLSIDTETPIVRGLKGENNYVNLGENPLRILVVASEPKRTLNIDAKDEIDKIEERIKGKKSLELDIVHRGTLSNIDAKTKTKNYNIIHFIGHGTFDTKKQMGYLILMKENGYSFPADETEIKNKFLNQTQVGLMILNACDTAQESEEVGGGLVPKLIERVPAVISMRGRVASEASSAFSSACYLSLAARNKSVEQIVTEARNTMFTTDYELKDWRDFSIPVLFMGLGRNEAKPTVVTSRCETLFRKSMPSEHSTIHPSVSIEDEPAVEVLRYFMSNVYDELNNLHNIFGDYLSVKSEKGSKTLRTIIIKQCMAGSDDLSKHVYKIGNRIRKDFPSTYEKIAETKTLLEDQIKTLKICFGEISKGIAAAQETLNLLDSEVENLYVETIRGILNKYSKEKKGGS